MKAHHILLIGALVTSAVIADPHPELEHYAQSKIGALRSQADFYSNIFLGGLDLRGFSLRTIFNSQYTTWHKLKKEIFNLIEDDVCENFACSNYDQEFAISTNSLSSRAKIVLPLVNGKASFDKRFEVISGAQKSIHILSWAFYDDETGIELQKLLLSKYRENPRISIKIIVDGSTSLQGHHTKVLKAIEAESFGMIEVVRWESKKYRANGNHRKMLIVDEEHMIMGGMNVGNVYSHRAGSDLWRDTDIYIQGNPAKIGNAIFAKIWNEQVRSNKKESDHTIITNNKNLTLDNFGTIPVVITDHNPGSDSEDVDENIEIAIIKLIMEAKSTLDIEHGYVILSPPMLAALEFARSKGVKIRVFMNSIKSADEPVMAGPMMKFAQEMFDLGIDIYFRKGSTLHSKFIVADEKIVNIGSYNLHPRSYRYEGEIVATVFDEKYAKQMTDVFENDIKPETADKVLSSADIVQDKKYIRALGSRVLFDQL